jgi:hypothetical protein
VRDLRSAEVTTSDVLNFAISSSEVFNFLTLFLTISSTFSFFVEGEIVFSSTGLSMIFFVLSNSLTVFFSNAKPTLFFFFY